MRKLVITENITLDGAIEMLDDWFDPQLQDEDLLELLGIALAGVAVVIFDTVAGPTAAWIAGTTTLVCLACFWVVVPLPRRRTQDTSY